MKPGLSKASVLELSLNALACLLGIIGIITGNKTLAYGSAIGGGLFFLSHRHEYYFLERLKLFPGSLVFNLLYLFSPSFDFETIIKTKASTS
jgi:hypothetical protein